MASHRYVLDEECLDLRALSVANAVENLRALAAQLLGLRNASEAIGLVRGWGSIACIGAMDLATVLNSAEPVDRDVRVVLSASLTKSVPWDEAPELVLSPDVTVDSEAVVSYGIAYALITVSNRLGMAVVTMPHRSHHGECLVTQAEISERVHFVLSPADNPGFLRTLYELEDVDEDRFMELAKGAFPSLVFANGLNFKGFTGQYRVLRPTVVSHLSALNDKFLAAQATELGDPSKIKARVGIPISIESSKTRRSGKKMRQRDVDYEGITYTCEWHTKIEPTRNRVHFCPREDGTLFVGLFVDHLDT